MNGQQQWTMGGKARAKVAEGSLRRKWQKDRNKAARNEETWEIQNLVSPVIGKQ